MSQIAVLASIILMSSGGSALDAGITSQNTQQPAATLVAHSSISVTKVGGDSTIQTAVDLLTEARKAIQVNDRRKHIKPGVQDRVVEKEKRQSDKILILGGKEAIPM